jgi:hypothetical protein
MKFMEDHVELYKDKYPVNKYKNSVWHLLHILKQIQWNIKIFNHKDTIASSVRSYFKHN